MSRGRQNLMKEIMKRQKMIRQNVVPEYSREYEDLGKKLLSERSSIFKKFDESAMESRLSKTKDNSALIKPSR